MGRPLTWGGVAALAAALLFVRFGPQTMAAFYGALWIAIAGYAAALAGAARAPHGDDRRAVGLAIALGAALRLVLATGGPDLSFDGRWYGDYVSFLRAGLAPYAGFYFPYPHGFADVLLAFVPFGGAAAAALHGLVIAADVAASALTAALAARALGPRFRLFGALAAAACPALILESGTSAHFEALVTLALAAALLAAARDPGGSGAWFSAAVLLKAIPAPAALVALLRSGRGARRWLAGALAIVSFSLVPFAARLGAVGRGWAALAGVGGPGRAGGGGPPFAINSLVALGQDVPALAFLARAAELALVATLLLAAAGAFRPAWDGALRRFAGAALAALALVMAGYALAQPLLPLFFRFEWYTPAAIAAGRGLFELAGGIVVASALRARLGAAASGALAMLAVTVATVLSRAAVNPWYLVPIVPFAVAAGSPRLAAGTLLWLCGFVAAWPSPQFPAVGLPEHAVRLAPSAVVLDGGPRSGGAFAPLPSDGVVPVAAHSAALYLVADVPARCRAVNVRAGEPSGAEVRLSRRAAAVRLPPGPAGTLRVAAGPPGVASGARPGSARRARCAGIRVALRPPAAPTLTVARAAGGGLVFTARPHRDVGGYADEAIVVLPADVRLHREQALAVDVRGDVDPTFHGAVLRWSAYGDVRAANGRRVRLPIRLDDASATTLGPVRLRIPLVPTLPDGARLDDVVLAVARIRSAPETHRLRFSAPAVVDERPRPATVLAGAAFASVFAAFALGLALRAIPLEGDAPEAPSRSASP